MGDAAPHPAIADLEGRVALVTGGSSGIGFELARSLAAEGARVAIAATRADRLERASQALRAEGAQVHAVPLDVGDEGGWPRALEAIEESWGPVDILCLNAGISTDMMRVEDTPPDVWRRIVDTNLTGVYLAVRAWLPQARQRDWAHLLITGSLTGLMPMAGSGAYGASKAGLWLLADILRAELEGSNVGISLFHPGVTRTAIAETSRRHNGGDPAGVDPRVADFLARGADPAKVATYTVAAMKRGEYHICTHPEHRERIAARFGEVLGAMGEAADGAREIRERPDVGGS